MGKKWKFKLKGSKRILLEGGINSNRNIETKYREVNKRERITKKKEQEQIINKQQLDQDKLIKQTQQKMLKLSLLQYAKQESVIRQKKSSQTPQISLCCRTSFYHSQIIPQSPSLHIIFHNFQPPFSPPSYFLLLKDICGLLNSSGGCIFIGIKTNPTTNLTSISGYTLLQSEKRTFKELLLSLLKGCILPKIVHKYLVKVEYVPLRDQTDGAYFHGGYVIKVKVKPGDRGEFYSYKEGQDNKKQWFAIRHHAQQTQIITNSQQIYAIYKDRVLGKAKFQKPIHEGDCKLPEQGKNLYQMEDLPYH